MATPLRTPVPSSSIARILDADAVNQAIAPAPPAQPARANPAHPVGSADTSATPPENPMITRDVVLTAESEAVLGELVAIFRRRTGARLNASVLVRSILRVIAQALPSIDSEAAKLPQMRLPSNAPGFERERQVFEQRLAEVIRIGIRRCDPGR